MVDNGIKEGPLAPTWSHDVTQQLRKYKKRMAAMMIKDNKEDNQGKNGERKDE